MKKKVFVTGISGFAGSHLAEYLLRQDEYDIYGTYLIESSLHDIPVFENNVIQLIQLDLTDAEKVKQVIQKIKPDLIFHLAAFTSPADSFANPSLALTNNIGIQINVLEAVKEAKLFDTRILITSSADIYGIVAKEDLPIDEHTEFKPTNPYAVSKIAQDFLGLQYFLSYGMQIIRVRPFNHIGPRQTPHFVVPSFAKKVVDIEKGKIEPVLFVGNLEAKRDFTDVRDMVHAYQLLIEKGKPGDVYNVGSGVSYKISDILDKLLTLAKTQITVKIDEKLLRPSDTPDLICDARKCKELTGWNTTISIEQSLKDILDYWRKIG